MVGPIKSSDSDFLRRKPRVLLGFVSYGPYHHSRLEACQRTLSEWDVRGWELSSSQSEYGWEHEGKSDLNAVTSLPLESIKLYEWLKMVWQSLGRLNPAVCVLAGYAHPGMLAAWLWCRWHGRGVVVMSDSKEDDAPRRLCVEWCKGQLLRRYDAAFVAGASHCRYFVKLGFPKDRIRMGYDVVDNDAYGAAHPKPSRSRPYFLTVSRLIPKKNLSQLLNAYHGYVREVGADQAWTLVICGDGMLREELEDQREKLGLVDLVDLTGFLLMKDLMPYLSHAQALVHASSQEQWGLVVNEAMAAGTPVIVSRECGCFEDLVEEGVNGLGFMSRDEVELTQALVEMHSMPESRRQLMGQRAQEKVNATHSLDHFAESFRACVEMALGQRPTKGGGTQ